MDRDFELTIELHNNIVVRMIPAFGSSGTLPPGIYEVNWLDFQSRFGWNSLRRHLLGGLERALVDLHRAGCRRVYVDGSFVTAKELPADFDACWDSAGVDPRLLDPTLRTFDPGRGIQKAKYFGELFRAGSPATASGLPYLQFFQEDRSGQPKGIVALDLRSWP